MSLPRDLIGTRAVFRQIELSSGFRRGKGKEEADERVNGTEGSAKGSEAPGTASIQSKTSWFNRRLFAVRILAKKEQA